MRTRMSTIAAATLCALAACDSKQDDATVGQKIDQAIAEAKTATEQARENARRGLDEAAEATKEASARAAQKTEQLAEKAERAGERVAQAGERAGENAARMAERAGDAAQRVGERAEQAAERGAAKTERAGERAGDRMSDATITAAVKADLAKDPELSALRIDVDTTGGRVSLAGTAPSEAARRRAQEIARSANGVTAVDNRLTVAAK